jgi:hypothetical protein
LRTQPFNDPHQPVETDSACRVQRMKVKTVWSATRTTNE